MLNSFKRRTVLTTVVAFFALLASGLLTSCSDDDKVEKLYKVYNTDTGADVPLFTSYNNHENGDTVYVPSRTACTIVNISEGEEKATTQIKVTGKPDTYYVQGKYLFVKKVDGESKLDAMYGKNRYVDWVIDEVRQLQDSHLHYTSSPFMLKIKFGLLFILFVIAVIYMIGGFDKAEEESGGSASVLDTGQKWYKCLPTVLIGLWMMYYLFVDVIVLGDGYFRAIESGPAFLDFRSLGWFLNLILTFVVGLLYLIFALVFSVILMFLQLILVPVIGVGMTGLSDKSILGNAALCIVAICGFFLSYWTGSDVVLYITLAACAGCVLWLLWAGYSNGIYQAILAVLLPALYLITIVSLSFLANFFVATASLLAVFLAVVGFIGAKSKFQSQGNADGSEYIADQFGNQHTVSSHDADYVHTTDGHRFRRRSDGTFEEG